VDENETEPTPLSKSRSKPSDLTGTSDSAQLTSASKSRWSTGHNYPVELLTNDATRIMLLAS
jgi:hypothetical protein